MTTDHNALTGMLKNHGAQMREETLRNGADLNISGAMLILSVQTQKKLFTSSVPNTKVI